MAKKKKYIGKCDELRRQSLEYEGYWQTVVANKKEIPFRKFIKEVDMSPILDEGETPEEFISDCLISDSETMTYVSIWNNQEAFFLETCGFEFIFV